MSNEWLGRSMTVSNCWICGTSLQGHVVTNFESVAVHSNCKTAYLLGKANAKAVSKPPLNSPYYFKVGSGLGYPASDSLVCAYAKLHLESVPAKLKIYINDSVPLAGTEFREFRDWFKEVEKLWLTA